MDELKDEWNVKNGLDINNVEAEKKMLDKLHEEKLKDFLENTSSNLNPGIGNSNLGAMIITPEEMEEIIKVLDQYTSKVKDSWNVSIKKAIDTLSSSWAGEACAQYINMIKGMDKNVQSALQALELLSNTYKSAREKALSINSNILSDVTNI